MQHREPKIKPISPSVSSEGKQKLRIFYVLPFCFFLFGGGLVGCSNSAPLGMHGLSISHPGVQVTKISELPRNANAIATVHLQGEVTDKAPFLAAGAYELQDATGTVWVITNQTVPDIGDRVLIKGQVQFQSIPVGGQDLGEIYVQEQEQLERRTQHSRHSVHPQGS